MKISLFLILYIPLVFVSGMGIYKDSLKQNHSINKNAQVPKYLNLPQSNKHQKFVRKQYRKSPAYHQQSKVIITSKTIHDTDLLAQIETIKQAPESKTKIPNQKNHPSDAPLFTSKNIVYERAFDDKRSTTITINKQPKVAKKENIDITDQLKEIQIIVNNIDKKKLIVPNTIKEFSSHKKSKDTNNLEYVSYWQTVYSIESKQGKLLYRPRNKARNCNYTLGPCGHHQLTVQALRDVGCKSLQCRKDRLDYNKSLQLSKRLLALNEKRLKKNGLSNLEGYQKYLIHQQGATGIKNIIAATKGHKELSKTIKKNMANNSPYSYRQFKRMGSKIAAKKFMQHWERKWISEKRLILASNNDATNHQENSPIVPVFKDKEIDYALNMLF